MLKLACIIDNPGEPPVETRYRDPQMLCDLGYNGVVIYETTGLSGVDDPEALPDREMRHWLSQRLAKVRRIIETAAQTGLQIYLCCDAPVLSRAAVNKLGPSLCCENNPDQLCPANEKTIHACAEALESLLQKLPPVDGVVLRFGDTDAGRLPYLIGNDLYKPNCPRCAKMTAASRISMMIRAFHHSVVEQLDKRLIVRAWNVRPGGLHDSVDLAREVADQLPGDGGDDRLILSYKFTQADFWRHQRWNPASRVFADRPVLYELECQREFEGKGGVPNWQAPLWRDGCPEIKDDPSSGLREVGSLINSAGVFVWVRGGGWGGPFVSSETWIDANVFAAPKLADDPNQDTADLARRWAQQRLRLTHPKVMETLVQLLEHSPQHVLAGFYIGAHARKGESAWRSSGEWIQDDLIDANALQRLIEQLPDADLDEVVAEKDAAVEQVAADRTALRSNLNADNRAVLEPLINTLLYAESLYAALRDLCAGLIAWRRYQQGGSSEQATLSRRRLLSAQSHWTHHTQRCGALPGCATAFRENHFWELTQDILVELSQAQTESPA